MTPTLIAALVILLLLTLIVLEVPIAVALLLASVIGILLIRGDEAGLGALGALPFNAAASYSLAAIPMFILMGTLASKAGLAQDLFDLANRFLRRLPGGLAIAGIAGCAGFAAVTGSSIATITSVGRTAMGEMRRHGYDAALAAGAIAAAGTLGILIPPSIVIVLLGVVTGTSIGALLVAGIVPGILTAIAYAGVVLVRTARRPALAGGPTVPGHAAATPPDRPPLTLAQFSSLGKVVLMFAIVLGGAFAGWYTVTEAAGIGAAAALLILLLGRRPAEGRRRSLVYAFTDSAQLTSNVFFIVVGGAVFTYFLVLSGAPSTFADWVTTLPIPPTALLVVILLAMVPVGMFLDALTISLVFVPLVFPIVEATGANPVWFCILAVKLIELGLITPPVGMNAFALSASVPDVPTETVYLGVIPFIVADVAVVALLFAFPDIILFLPEMLGA